MMRGPLITASVLSLFFALTLVGEGDGARIEHVVVLMLENRAFDHMCGFLKQLNPNIDGLNGDESNPLDPTDPKSILVQVSNTSEYIDINPNHQINGTAIQTFGYYNANDTYDSSVAAPMNGFVKDVFLRTNSTNDAINVMKCFSPKTVPAISTLAQEFVLFDRWHSSVPGPTEVNRMYVHSATSQGMTFDDQDQLVWGFPQKTIYESLEESKISWKIYMEQITTVLYFNSMRRKDYMEKMRFFDDFAADAKAGTLPAYSFLEPRYASETSALLANDQHPSHDVSEGERLIAYVYTLLRSSPQWNSTLLIVTYDEHGGFFDHHPIPQVDIPNPDGILGQSPFFHFSRLGVRVPTIMASPWLPKGYVEHEPLGPTPSSQYEHSSIAATLKKMFGLNSFLTKRDSWAGTFEHLFDILDEPRTDCPMSLPVPPKLKPNSQKEYLQQVNNLQKGFVELAALSTGVHSAAHLHDITQQITTEYKAGQFMVQQMEKLLGRNKK